MVTSSASGWLLVVQVLSALLTPTIAVCAAWIAYQQVKINRNKLKLDRFERRFAIYDAAKSYITQVHFGDPKTEPESASQYLASIRGAQFMLSKEIEQYLRDLASKGIHLRMAERELERPNVPEEEHKAAAAKSMELHKWFTDQFEELDKRFASYLVVED